MYAQVVFPLPFRNSFTYIIPEDQEDIVQMGVRVVVPFGKRTITGFVISVSHLTEVKEKLKTITDVLDTKPIFDEQALRFYEWLAEYYLCSLGEALKLCIPYGLEVESKRKIIPDKEFCRSLFEKEKRSPVKKQILDYLSSRDELTLSSLQTNVKRKNIYSYIRTLEKQGALTILDEIVDAKVKPKKVRCARLTMSLQEVYDLIPSIEARSPKQVMFLLELVSKKNKTKVISKILKKIDSNNSVVEALVKKGIIEVYEKEVERVYTEQFQEKFVDFELTPKQKEVISEFESNADKFNVSLLYGVTGSGKTQIYIEIIKKILKQNKTALLLVPEISLTPQITTRLFNNFKDLITVLHSKISIGERYDAWRKILSGNAKVVIGARSALFAPLKNIGVVIIDEEHDQSYKQTDLVPRYNGRDCGIMLGKYFNCPVLLGSATPSVESMYNALNDKYKMLTLPDRVDDATLPIIHLINILNEKKNKRMENVFSSFLLSKIDDRLKKKEGVIILQNRRGFSTQIYCEDCGQVEVCINCSVPMVFHINSNILQCHYCSYTKEVPKACIYCGSLSLKYFGAGTERVEDELSYYFPDAKIKRIDSDSISRKNALSEILNSFGKGEVDILVGTQMVSKGMDFARVTLAAVISAETSLWMPDFRAEERTFQLLTQVAGRSGRSVNPGEVIIQTQNEKHFILQKVLQHDYDGFYQKEIRDREQHFNPPFSRLCLIETKDLEEENAKGAINDFYKYLKAYNKLIIITAPATAMISKLKGFYRYQIVIKSIRKNDPSGKILREAILNTFVRFNRESKFRETRITFDVDPQSIF